MNTQNKNNKKGKTMKTYQVTDFSTGEVFVIEAVSASMAAQAFRKEGRSVKIKPFTEEVNKMNPKTTNTQKEAGSMMFELFYDQGWFPILCSDHLYREYKLDKTSITMQQWSKQRQVKEVFTNEKCEWCKQETNTQEKTKMKVEQIFKPLTDKQVKYIRDLFKAKKEFMTIDEQKSLINKMKSHLDGSSPLTAKWGIGAINKLKSYNKERSAS